MIVLLLVGGALRDELRLPQLRNDTRAVRDVVVGSRKRTLRESLELWNLRTFYTVHRIEILIRGKAVSHEAKSFVFNVCGIDRINRTFTGSGPGELLSDHVKAHCKHASLKFVHININKLTFFPAI